jgi:hypothetical protein
MARRRRGSRCAGCASATRSDGSPCRGTKRAGCGMRAVWGWSRAAPAPQANVRRRLLRRLSERAGRGMRAVWGWSRAAPAPQANVRRRLLRRLSAWQGSFADLHLHRFPRRHDLAVRVVSLLVDHIPAHCLEVSRRQRERAVARLPRPPPAQQAPNPRGATASTSRAPRARPSALSSRPSRAPPARRPSSRSTADADEARRLASDVAFFFGSPRTRGRGGGARRGAAAARARAEPLRRRRPRPPHRDGPPRHAVSPLAGAPLARARRPAPRPSRARSCPAPRSPRAATSCRPRSSSIATRSSAASPRAATSASPWWKTPAPSPSAAPSSTCGRRARAGPRASSSTRSSASPSSSSTPRGSAPSARSRSSSSTPCARPSSATRAHPRAKRTVRDLVDAVEIPSSQVQKLLDDVESGRAFFGAEGFLPAYYEALEPVDAYLPPDVVVLWDRPARALAHLRDELARAARDHAARVEKRLPTFPFAPTTSTPRPPSSRAAHGTARSSPTRLVRPHRRGGPLARSSSSRASTPTVIDWAPSRSPGSRRTSRPRAPRRARHDALLPSSSRCATGRPRATGCSSRAARPRRPSASRPCCAATASTVKQHLGALEVDFAPSRASARGERRGGGGRARPGFALPSRARGGHRGGDLRRARPPRAAQARSERASRGPSSTTCARSPWATSSCTSTTASGATSGSSTASSAPPRPTCW